MANTQTSTILSGAYVNPFAQAAKPAKVQGILPLTQSSAKPEFADLIAANDKKLVAHSQSTTQPESTAVAQESSADYTFFDVIDMINPLQHIPVVSNIYRAVTGDEIRQEIRMAGNVLFGAITGPVGIAMGVGSAAVDYATGKPVGDHVLAAVAPDLESTIRKEYSIAHYLHNPFESDGAAEVAAAVVQPQSHAPVQGSADAAQLYAQTASAFGQTLNQNASLPEVSSAQIALSPEAKEAQAMAKSVAYDPQSVVQLSSGAAAQLSRLASGAANMDALGLEMLNMSGDSAAQLRSVTSKNRQLGLALNSSASISHQMDTVSQRDMSMEIGNKVAALYNQNSGITHSALNNAQMPAPTFFDVPTNVAPVPIQVAENTSAVRQQPLQPQQLGKHYHGAGNTGDLSIAAAMQQALNKYQNLRRN